ncbi:MAG: DMT family transporter [Hyphomicrobiaceae bacterium]
MPEIAPERRRSHGFAARWRWLPGNVRGAVWMLAAALFFSVMLALIKLVGRHLPVSQVLLLRQMVMFVTVLPVIIAHFPENMITHRPWLHAGRVLCALTAMYCGFTAVVHIPLADATAISFAKAFFITIFAIIFLGETVGIRRWMATIVGFIGVLVMLKPTGGGLNIYGLLALIGAAAASLVMISIRVLTRTERSITILTYQAVFVGVVILPFALWQWVTPTLYELALVVGIGVVSVGGQMCNINAYKAGEATVVSSLDFSRLLWAALIGLVLFDQLPGWQTWAGASLVVSAALYTLIREARRGRRLNH